MTRHRRGVAILAAHTLMFGMVEVRVRHPAINDYRCSYIRQRIGHARSLLHLVAVGAAGVFRASRRV